MMIIKTSEEFDDLINKLEANDVSLRKGVQFNSFKLDEVKIHRLAAALEKNNTLTSLNLRGNEIGDVGAEKLAAALKKNNTLTNLNLRGNEIGDVGAEKLAAALEINKTLTSLTLAFNNIGALGAEKLAAALEINKTLTSLTLAFNNIGALGAEKLAALLEKNNTLTELNLVNNRISDAGAEKLATALEKNNTLINLILERNNIGDVGAEALAVALEKNSTLTRLGLMQNNICDAGAEKLAALLEKNNTLTELDLSCNRIDDAGVEKLAIALEKNSTLTCLGLRFNNIGALGAEKLAALLKKNNTLTSLNLYYNKIGDLGAEKLAAALKINKTLIQLNLSENNVSAEGVKNLADALKNNYILTSLIGVNNQKIKLYIQRNISLLHISLLKMSQNEELNYRELSILEAHVNVSDTDLKRLGVTISPEMRNKIKAEYNKALTEKMGSLMGLQNSSPGEGVIEWLKNNPDFDDLMHKAENYFGRLRKTTKEIEDRLIELIASARYYKCESAVIDRHFKLFLHYALNAGMEMQEICTNFNTLCKDKQTLSLIKQDPQILGPLVCYKSGMLGNNIERLIGIINHDAFKTYLEAKPEQIVNIMKLSEVGNESARYYECEPCIINKNFILFLHDALDAGMKMKQVCTNFNTLCKDKQTLSLIEQDPQILGPLVCYKSEMPGNNIERLIGIINHNDFKAYLKANPKRIINIIKLSEIGNESLLEAADMIKENPQLKSLRDLVAKQNFEKYNTIPMFKKSAGKKELSGKIRLNFK